MCSMSSQCPCTFSSCSPPTPPLNFHSRQCMTTSLNEQQTNSKIRVKRRWKVRKAKASSSSPLSLQFPTHSWFSRSWALWGQWFLLNHLCICALALAIAPPPTLLPQSIHRQSSEQEHYQSTAVPQILLQNGFHPPMVAQFVSQPTRRTLSILFPVPTVVSQVVSTATWNSSLSSSSPSKNELHKRGPVLRLSSTPSPISPLPKTRFLEAPEKGNVSRLTVLVPKSNLSTSEQAEVTTAYHSSSLSRDEDTLEDGDSARTTVLEIIDRSPFILNLPISPHNSDIDPIVRRMLEKGTTDHLATTTTATTTQTTNISTTGGGSSSDVENHLTRAGRQTHHDFIKRILNAVSVDSHNVNRYVHLVRPKGGRPQGGTGDQVTDLGLPADIADEYIDGVNPPKFPGLKDFHPLIEKNDWRGPFKLSKPKKPGPLVTVVDPDRESPNLYSKLMSRQNQTSANKPKHFLPDFSGPMQPVIKTESTQQEHKSKLQPLPRPPQYALPKTTPNRTTGQVEDNFSLNNRNVYKSKLSVSPQSSRDNAKHDLSLLLKQEFDAKNAELNQTKAQPMAISPGGQVLPPPPLRPGQKMNTHFSSTQSNMNKLNKSSTTGQFNSVNPLTGPPYQLPVELMNTSLTSGGSGSNNAAMKEGVHYKTVSSLALPPELTSTTSTTTERSQNSRFRTPKPLTTKNKHKEVIPVTDKNIFVRIRTGVRRPRPKSTTSTTTTESSLVDDDNSYSTPSSSLSSSRLSSTPVTSPKFVTTISNDVRFQVESSNRANFTQYSVQPAAPPASSPPENDINELELNSDESRVLFNTSLENSPSDQAGQHNMSSSNIVDDSVSIVPVTRQSTSYRLTTERLAYILIGTCCGLAVLVLIIVAMSVRCKDMCSEYRSWKSAEKAALRWHRHNRRRGGAGLSNGANALPYPMLARSRFNLPRYFRTSIDNAKLRAAPMEAPFPSGNALYANKALGNILHGSKAEGGKGGAENSSGACCHCIDCSSTWFFRNDKHGGWCCQRGYYQPPRRTKLPFGAASSVNTFMPRMDHSSDHLQTNNAHMQSGSECGAAAHEPIGRLQRNASEPNLGDIGDMCFNDLSDSAHGHFGRVAGGFDARLREKANSSGAIPVKVNMSSNPRFSDILGGGNQFSKCRLTKKSLFCQIDDDEEDDDDDDDGDVTTDFSNVFETNFGDEPSKPSRKSNKANHCNRTTGPSHSSVLYSQQKCPNLGLPMKTHKSDQTGGEGNNKLRGHQKRHQSHLPEYYNPSTGKYYFDSTSIAKLPLDAYRNVAVGNTNGESSTIWINSSKLVDKLHRKHQASRRKAADGHHRGHRGEGGEDHRRTGHHHQHDRQTTGGPSGGESSGDGQRNRRHRNHHRSSHHQQQHRSREATGRGGGGGGEQCLTHFDPGLFARLALPGKLPPNEHNFVVWNDTSERLI